MSFARNRIQIRHRVGWLGKSAIVAAYVLSRIGMTLPTCVIVWAIEHSSYVRVGDGPWRRIRLNLRTEDL